MATTSYKMRGFSHAHAKVLFPMLRNVNNVVFILVATQHPGNIGAAARAMKTMGLGRLRLVSPRHFPSDEATARASGADDVLQNAEVFTSLADAVADCHWVAGTTARDRGRQWPEMQPRALAERTAERVGAGQKVAIVFGRENSGLSNDELELCHAMIRIPANPDYSSLNLGSAVQVISYEMQLALLNDAAPATAAEEVAEQGQIEGMTQHLQQALEHIGYIDPQEPRYLMHRLRRQLEKLELRPDDVNVVRGICKEVLKGKYG